MDAHDIAPDEIEGRVGNWMHTSLGNKFFPADPQPEEVFIEDIANGLALDCRYAGQGRTDRFYSVAEHSIHMTSYAWDLGWPAPALLATLLHDAAEAYINDLPRATKMAVGQGYALLEFNLQRIIERKFEILSVSYNWKGMIKNLDRRIVPVEKAAIMEYPQPWAHDIFNPLPGVTIECWSPTEAKERFLRVFNTLQTRIEKEKIAEEEEEKEMMGEEND